MNIIPWRFLSKSWLECIRTPAHSTVNRHVTEGKFFGTFGTAGWRMAGSLFASINSSNDDWSSLLSICLRVFVRDVRKSVIIRQKATLCLVCCCCYYDCYWRRRRRWWWWWWCYCRYHYKVIITFTSVTTPKLLSSTLSQIITFNPLWVEQISPSMPSWCIYVAQDKYKHEFIKWRSVHSSN